jgi:hypothetical protein
VTSHASPPPGAISYEQWLRERIAGPAEICGPPVIDDRQWWQHLPGLNPYADLERQAREARRQPEREAGS